MLKGMQIIDIDPEAASLRRRHRALGRVGSMLLNIHAKLYFAPTTDAEWSRWDRVLMRLQARRAALWSQFCAQASLTRAEASGLPL